MSDTKLTTANEVLGSKLTSEHEYRRRDGWYRVIKTSSIFYPDVYYTARLVTYALNFKKKASNDMELVEHLTASELARYIRRVRPLAALYAYREVEGELEPLSDSELRSFVAS